MTVLSDLNAVYFDGKTPIKRPVVVTLSGDQIEFGERKILLAQLKIEMIRGNCMYLHIDHGNGERLELSNVELIEKISTLKPSWQVNITEGVNEKIFLALIVVVALVAILWIGTPWIAQQIAQQIPAEQEIKLRPLIEKQLSSEICAAPEKHAILQKLADHLLAVNGINTSVKVYYGAHDEVNAYALPGGIAIFYPGIIKKMKSPDVLAGVMAHELQHQVQRHITVALVRATLMTVIWSAALGDFSGILVVDPSTLASLANLKYSRDNESVADEQGMLMLEKAGIAVMPTLDFLDELGKMAGAIPEFLVNHPIESRTVGLRKRFAVPAVGTGAAISAPATEPVMSAEDWASLVAGCTAVKK